MSDTFTTEEKVDIIISNVVSNITNTYDTVSDWTSSTYSSAASTVSSTATNIVSSVTETYETAVNAVTSAYDSVTTTASDIVSASSDSTSTAVSNISEYASTTWTQITSETDTDTYVGTVSSTITNVISFIETSLLSIMDEDSLIASMVFSVLGSVSSSLVYVDGISETEFGTSMEESWYQDSDSFLNYFSTGSASPNVNILSYTPLSSSSSSSIYGNMILGIPPAYIGKTDPNNRASINTFMKDGRVLSLTPGLPKFNGGYTEQLLTSIGTGTASTYLTQTTTGDEMLSYLLRNGLDSTFSSKDKRYYVFQSKYSEYFAYLETMLNAVWIKLGLSKSSSSSGSVIYDIFSFFNIKDGTGIDGSKYNSIIEEYRSPLGFYINASGSFTESISNQEYTSDLANNVNSNSDTFQQLNYITGMGTGSVLQQARRAYGGVTQNVTNLGTYITETFGSSITSGINTLFTSADVSATVQQFNVSNGMKVMYPNLWSDSSYSKSMNFNFSFTSPYGDPLSIFHHVYVPFCALLAFALPRQAAENGYVSPFFVRADIPGMLTSDLALISDMSWTKGGDANLWTKDGIPRSISGSFTISDLYPYLSMTKRLSFLSANPSYTVFLDNMAGVHAIYNSDDSSDILNTYWNTVINRVTGDMGGDTMFNTYDSSNRSLVNIYKESPRSSFSYMTNIKNIPWMSSRKS